jgi:hypothetical protein
MPKAKIALAMPRSLLYRFQCRKKSLENHLKVWRKKNVFAEKYDEIRRFDGIFLLKVPKHNTFVAEFFLYNSSLYG